MRDIEVEFAVECHQAQDRFLSLPSCQSLQVPFTALQVAKQEGSVAATGSLFNHPALSLPQVCPTAFKVAENEEGYVLRYYNMSQENVRVSDKQQTILDFLERPYPVHSRTIGATRNSYRIDQKEEI